MGRGTEVSGRSRFREETGSECVVGEETYNESGCRDPPLDRKGLPSRRDVGKVHRRRKKECGEFVDLEVHLLFRRILV